jgi:hypothetical protein
MMSETISQEIVVPATLAAANEKVVDRKTIVYETRTDPTVIKLAAEKIKDQLFTRFGFLKPKPEEVEFVGIDKYYEPYMAISGCYMIDYYRKCLHVVEIDKEVKEIILLDRKFEPEKPPESPTQDYSIIKLEGEERLVNEYEASLILDSYGRDVSLEGLPSAPSERNPKKILAEFNIPEVAPNSDLDVIRAKIVKRPTDINRVVSELFEVDERAVIYTPRFRVTLKNTRTGEEKTVEFDGVTAQRIHKTKHKETRNIDHLPPPPPAEKENEKCQETPS